jgi:regulator of cell morphogenesis and NO signaling
MKVQLTDRTALVSADDSLNTIVARHPEALPVFQRFGLDTCCGGSLTLRTAAQHHDLDLDTIVAALTRAIAEPAQ